MWSGCRVVGTCVSLCLECLMRTWCGGVVSWRLGSQFGVGVALVFCCCGFEIRLFR